MMLPSCGKQYLGILYPVAHLLVELSWIGYATQPQTEEYGSRLLLNPFSSTHNPMS